MVFGYKQVGELGTAGRQASEFEKIASVHLIVITAGVQF